MRQQSWDVEYLCSSALFLWSLSSVSGDKICVVLILHLGYGSPSWKLVNVECIQRNEPRIFPLKVLYSLTSL